MKTIGWGMIGCGDVTEVKNGPGLYTANNSKLVGITNRTLSKAYDWVKRHGAGKVYESVQELLSDNEIDIVYIATTPDSHKKYAIMCAEAGKHCYVEKPIALSYEDAEEIKKAFEKSGTKIFVAHYRREMERFKTIKKLMEDGKIGRVRAADILHTQVLEEAEKSAEGKPWRVCSEVSGGGHFFEGDIHMVDLTDFFFGPAYDVKINADNQTGFYSGEDIVSLTMRTQSGVIVSGMWYYTAFKGLDCYRIIGDRGMITFKYEDNLSPIEVNTIEGTEELIPPVPENIGTPMIQSIVDELNGTGKCASTLDSAMRSLKIASDAVKIYRETRK